MAAPKKTARPRIVWLAAGLGLLAVAAVLAYRLWPQGTMGSVDASSPELLALGQEVYGESCASCHGDSLEGQPNWRIRRADGRLPAPPHDETGHTWHHPDDQLFAITKFGPAAVAGLNDYQIDMPVFEGVLSDEEISAALAYIKSTWPAEIRARHDDINRRNQSN